MVKKQQPKALESIRKSGGGAATVTLPCGSKMVLADRPVPNTEEGNQPLDYETFIKKFEETLSNLKATAQGCGVVTWAGKWRPSKKTKAKKGSGDGENGGGDGGGGGGGTGAGGGSGDGGNDDEQLPLKLVVPHVKPTLHEIEDKAKELGAESQRYQSKTPNPSMRCWLRLRCPSAEVRDELVRFFSSGSETSLGAPREVSGGLASHIVASWAEADTVGREMAEIMATAEYDSPPYLPRCRKGKRSRG